MNSFNWSDYLELAKRLSLQKDEASLRTAISRSYYYVFHLALARAESNAYVPSRQMGSHRDMWLLYDASPVPECKLLGFLGQRIQKRRVTADYKVSFPQLEDAANSVFSDVDRFASMLARPDPRHPQPSSARR